MIPGNDATEPLLTRAARGYRATLVSQAIRVLCKAGAVVIVARLVTPADHGRFAMAASVFFVLVLFRDAGLGPGAVQARVLSEEQCSTLARAHVWLGIVLGSLAVALAPLAAWFYRDPPVAGLLASMGATFVLLGFNSWPRVLLARELRFTELNRIETAAAVVATLAMIGSATAGAGGYAFVFFLVATELVVLVLVWRVCRWRPHAPVRWRSLAGFWRAGVDVTGYQLLVAVSQQLDSLLMGRWFGAAPLGFYNRPNQLLALPNQHVCGPIVQVLMASLSRIGTTSAEFAPHVRQTANLIGYLTLPFAAFCVALPNEIVRLVLGAAWPDAAPLLRWLALGWGAVYLTTPVYALCVATARTRRLAWMSATNVAALLIGLSAGRSYGPQGLAAGVALANVVLLGPKLWWSTLGTRVRLRDFAAAFAGPLVFAVAVLVGARGGAMLLEGSGWPVRLTGGLIAGGLAAAITLGCSARLRAEATLLWRRRPGHSAEAGSPSLDSRLQSR